MRPNLIVSKVTDVVALLLALFSLHQLLQTRTTTCTVQTCEKSTFKASQQWIGWSDKHRWSSYINGYDAFSDYRVTYDDKEEGVMSIPGIYRFSCGRCYTCEEYKEGTSFTCYITNGYLSDTHKFQFILGVLLLFGIVTGGIYIRGFVYTGEWVGACEQIYRECQLDNMREGLMHQRSLLVSEIQPYEAMFKLDPQVKKTDKFKALARRAKVLDQCVDAHKELDRQAFYLTRSAFTAKLASTQHLIAQFNLD